MNLAAPKSQCATNTRNVFAWNSGVRIIHKYVLYTTNYGMQIVFKSNINIDLNININ